MSCKKIELQSNNLPLISKQARRLQWLRILNSTTPLHTHHTDLHAGPPPAKIPFASCGNKDGVSGVALTDADCGTDFYNPAASANVSVSYATRHCRQHVVS